jgi:hypothetical protein
MVDSELREGLANLQDAFLNCSLLKKSMDTCCVVENAVEFHLSDRGRFERLWVAALAVLVESWHSSHMKPVREYIRTTVSTKDLTELLRESRKSGLIDAMIATRHYMFHRDKRKYWDPGRNTPVGRLKAFNKLHQSFSKVLLVATKKMGDEIKTER